MLDTDICIALIKRQHAPVLKSLAATTVGDVGISSVTLAELEFGVARSLHAPANEAALDDFLLPLEIAAFDEVAARRYGVIRATLEKRGTPIGSLDTMIAAHALAVDATLVTHNARKFSHVKGLKIVDWLKS